MKNVDAGSRVLAWILCGALTLPLAACKKNTKGTDGTDGSGDASASSTSQELDVEMDAAGRPKYVSEHEPYYSDETVKFELPADADETDVNYRMTSGFFWGENVVILYNVARPLSEAEKEEMNNINYNNHDELMRFYELQHSQYEEGVLIQGLDGQLKKQIKFEPFESFECYFTKGEEQLGVLLRDFDPEMQVYSQKAVLMNEAGERTMELKLDNDGLENCRDFMMLDNGNILFASGYPAGVTLLDAQGKEIGSGMCDGEVDSFLTIEGDIYLFSRSSNNVESMIQKVDLATGQLGPTTKLQTNTYSSWIEENGAFYKGGEGIDLIRCDILTGTEETVLNFDYTDVAKSVNVGDIKVSADENEVYYLTNKYSGSGENSTQEIYLTKLHREEKNPHSGKRIIYVATCTQDFNFEELLAAYNADPNSKTRVRLYQPQGETGLPYDKMMSNIADNILLSMKSGTGPDILLNCAAYSQFNTSNILVDLNTYMDGANGIDRSQYFDNIFRAFEMNGKLYQMPISVAMEGFVGNPDLLGQIDGWTPQEFSQKMEGLGTDTYPLVGYSQHLNTKDFMASDQMGMLVEMLYHDMNHYVDFDQNVAHFDSEDFIGLLEIAKQYGGKLTPDKLIALCEEYDSWSYHDSYSLMMEDGVCALDVFAAGNLYNFARYADLCGNEPCFIGWPTSKGQGVAATAEISVGISAFSECKDEAWDFIAFMLRPETTDAMTTADTRTIWVARASTQKAIDASIEDYAKMVELYKDEPGRLETEPVLNQETGERFIRSIEQISDSVQTNPTIVDIVLEEVPAYFDGSKSAEQVSKTIQDRVTILMNESK